MAKARDFKVGEVVALRSGGPRMTVEQVRDSATDPVGAQSVDCHWFSGTKLEWARFSALELVLIARLEREVAQA